MDKFGNPDAIDRAILRVLQRDSALSYDKIAQRLLDEEKIGIDQSNVSKRKKALEEGGFIISYRATVNLEKLGLPQAVLLFIELENHQPAVTNAFEELINDHYQNVIECMKITGDWDYVLKLVTRDLKHLDEIRDSLTKFPEICRTRTYTIYGEQTSVPPL